MLTLLVTRARISIWHFAWIAVSLSVLLSLFLSQLIHGRIVWEYPSAATVIAVTVASLVIFLIKRVKDMEKALVELTRPYVLDPTEHRRTENALFESQARFSCAFRDAAIGMALVGTDGHWLQVNPALCKLVGYTEQELLATTFQAITHPDDLDTDLAFVRQMLAGEISTYQMEKRYFHKFGHIVWILLSVSLVRDPVDQPFYFIGQIQDITERKQAEEALRESEARYQLLIEAIPQQVWTARPDGTLDYVNRRVLDYFDCQPDDLLGWEWQSVLHPDDLPTCLETWSSSLRTGEPYEIEFRLRRACDGAYRWHLARAMPVKDVSNRILRWFGTNTDITESKRVNDELLVLKNDLASELMAMSRLHEFSTRLVASTDLQLLLEEVLNATMTLQDADFGTVQLYNPQIRALEIVAHRGFQQNFLEYLSRVHDSSSACGRALEERERVIIEDVETDPRFEPHRPIAALAGFRAVQSTPLFSRSGEPLGMISTHFRQVHRPSERDLRLTDLYARPAAEMIDRKRREEALLDSELRLRLALEDRERLSLDLHDNVIQSIYAIGMALESCHYLIKEDPGIAARRLQRSIADLNGVIKEVRNYLEWPSPTITNSAQLREALENLVRTIPSAPPLAIPLQIDPSTVGQLTADEATHVLQIAREAISNSLRHSGAKTRGVSLSRTERGLCLEVRDDGVGFDTKSRERQGLGLRNMAARAHKLGAELKIISECGIGTRIILDIPKDTTHAP